MLKNGWIEITLKRLDVKNLVLQDWQVISLSAPGHEFSVPNIHYMISYVLYMTPCIMKMGINFRLNTYSYANQDKIWFPLQASGSTLERAAKILKNPIKLETP